MTTLANSSILIELFGVPQLLTGARLVHATGNTLADLTADLATRYPALIGKIIDPDTRRLLPGYTFVVDERFTRDPAAPISTASSVLLVSSVAGG